jgi:hypothetical protein
MPTALRASVWSWPDRGVKPVELGAEVESSSAETLPRWYFTVRTLINNRLPISAFDRPGRRAITVSWGQCMAGRDGALAGGLASSLQLAPGSLGERLDGHRSSRS